MKDLSILMGNGNEVIILKFGDKISIYKDILDLKSFQEFGEESKTSGDWLNELSKKDELKFVDIQRLIKLCEYLGITVEQLLEDDNIIVNTVTTNKEINSINSNCDDIGTLIDEIISILNNDGIKMDGKNLNNRAKKMCKNALEITKTLTKQYL